MFSIFQMKRKLVETEVVNTTDCNKIKVKDEKDRPVIIRGALARWPCMDWGEKGWLEVLGDREIEVRFGDVNPRYKHPTWERCTEVKRVNASKLLLSSERTELVGNDKWAYWDYKYLAQILPHEQMVSFPWADLGFPDRDGEDSTLWIGTKGANTPCHQDAYGTNLVAQLIGRKTWTLFPPSDSAFLNASRIPYEESSIYSHINFENLEKNSESTLENLSRATPYIVTLQPGEVLYVPRHWWHFVVNEEFSISVNTWLPHPSDSKARLEEALVRVQAAMTARQLPQELKPILLNPNESDLKDEDISSLHKLCQQMATIILKERGNAESFMQPNFGGDFNLLSASSLALPKKSSSEFDIANGRENHEFQALTEDSHLLKAYQAFTAPEVISAAADVYLKNFT